VLKIGNKTLFKVFILLEVFFQELPQWELADFPTLVTHWQIAY